MAARGDLLRKREGTPGRIVKDRNLRREKAIETLTHHWCVLPGGRA